MTDFVLVHGAWHGGWCWERVASRLHRHSAAHTVLTPSLSGLAERRHLARHRLDLDTHVADVVSLVEWQDLRDIVLCGHSYGGVVVTGAADRLGDRVASLVYLDAFVPADGDTAVAAAGAPVPETELLDPPSASYFGLTGTDAALVDARLTPHPAATTTQPLTLRGLLPPRLFYVLATQWQSVPTLQAAYARAQQDPAWTATALDGHHDLMLARPDEVTELLLAAATVAR